MLARFFIIFISIPLIELFLLIEIGRLIGVLNTVLLVVITGAVGGYLAKREGLSCLYKIRAKLDSGTLPGQELIDGAFILVSGTLLITPGIITDALGLLGLIPASRRFFTNWISKKFTRKVSEKAEKDYISVEYEVKD